MDTAYYGVTREFRQLLHQFEADYLNLVDVTLSDRILLVLDPPNFTIRHST